MLGRILAISAFMCALFAVIPASASAHHADLSASVTCSGTVSYTASAWQTGNPDARVNNSVTVTVNGATAASGGFNAGNGYQLSGTYDVNPNVGSVTVTVTWGNFGPTGQFGAAGSGSKVLSITPCPAQPGGSISGMDCGAGGAIVSLTNTGGQPASFTILKDGAVVHTLSVNGGASAQRAVTIAEDTTANIVVQSGGGTITSKSVEANCIIPPAQPGGTISDATCAAGGANISLTNTGGQTATFTIKVNGASIGTQDVAGGSNGSKFIPVAEDTTVFIEVSSGNFAASKQVQLDCVPAPPAEPGATIGAIDCATGGTNITMTNTGGETATFAIKVNGTLVDTVDVLGGANAIKFIALTEDVDTTIEISSGNFTTGGSIKRDCQAPVPGGAIGDLVCGDGGAYVNLTNTGDQTATFTITVNGAAFASVDISANSNGNKFVPITEDTSATIKVTSGAFSAERTIARDCTPDTPNAPTPPTTPTEPTFPGEANTPGATDGTPAFPGAPSVVVVDPQDVTVQPAVVEVVDTETVASTEQLPFTGAPDTTPIIIGGIVSIVLGMFLLANARLARRRRGATATQEAVTSA